MNWGIDQGRLDRAGAAHRRLVGRCPEERPFLGALWNGEGRAGERQALRMTLRRLVGTAVLAVAPPMLAAEGGSMDLGERVVQVRCIGSGENGQPRTSVGTGFRLGRSNLVATARHVVAGRAGCRVGVVPDRLNQQVVYEDVLRVEYPPQNDADLAMLVLEEDASRSWEFFELMEKPDHELGHPVASYGFPGQQRMPRLMFGHVQRTVMYSAGRMVYELGFPAFKGQSGSPVFSNGSGARARHYVLAVVSKSTTYVQDVDNPVSASASWAIGESLFPHADWIEGLVCQPSCE